jgi:hypothetical protein
VCGNWAGDGPARAGDWVGELLRLLCLCLWCPLSGDIVSDAEVTVYSLFEHCDGIVYNNKHTLEMTESYIYK